MVSIKTKGKIYKYRSLMGKKEIIEVLDEMGIRYTDRSINSSYLYFSLPVGFIVPERKCDCEIRYFARNDIFSMKCTLFDNLKGLSDIGKWFINQRMTVFQRKKNPGMVYFITGNRSGNPVRILLEGQERAIENSANAVRHLIVNVNRELQYSYPVLDSIQSGSVPDDIAGRIEKEYGAYLAEISLGKTD
ncbi:MAG: hypothetical protein K5770_13700 [Lachnospiraceae bacterium]|nr:hypothetical protein [Lachnospiraceae bacterium]